MPEGGADFQELALGGTAQGRENGSGIVVEGVTAEGITQIQIRPAEAPEELGAAHGHDAHHGGARRMPCLTSVLLFRHLWSL